MSGINRITSKPLETSCQPTKPIINNQLPTTTATSNQDTTTQILQSLSDGFAVKNGIDKTKFQLQNPVPLHIPNCDQGRRNRAIGK